MATVFGIRQPIVSNETEIRLTYLRIKTMFQCHNIGMRVLDKLSHDLKLSIFKPLVLKNFLDRHHFICFHDLGLEDDTETTVSDYSLR